ncbi:hypothetical protein ACWDE9_11320, partial [Streptomyces olivaceoviridis]
RRVGRRPADQRGRADGEGRGEPGGRHTVVLTAADGLEGPTSLAVRGRTAYVASAAYFTDEDPNLLAARIVPAPGK